MGWIGAKMTAVHKFHESAVDCRLSGSRVSFSNDQKEIAVRVGVHNTKKCPLSTHVTILSRSRGLCSRVEAREEDLMSNKVLHKYDALQNLCRQ